MLTLSLETVALLARWNGRQMARACSENQMRETVTCLHQTTVQTITSKPWLAGRYTLWSQLTREEVLAPKGLAGSVTYPCNPSTWEVEAGRLL